MESVQFSLRDCTMDAEHDQKKVETSGSKTKPKDQKRGKPSTRYYHSKKLKQKQKQKDGDTGNIVDGSSKEHTTADVKDSTATGDQDSMKSKPLANKSKSKVKKGSTGGDTGEGSGTVDVGKPSKVKPTSKLKPTPKAKEKTTPKVKSKSSAKPKPNTDEDTDTTIKGKTKTKAKAKVKAKAKAQGPKASALRAKTRAGKKKFNIAKRKEYQRRKMEASRGFKLVLRLLPPGLTEDEFVTTLKPVFEEASLESRGITELYFVPGSGSLALFQEVVYSRGYLVFEGFEQMRQFAMRVAELVFVDSSDNASKPSLQVSPYFKTLDNSTLVAALSKSSQDTSVGTVTAADVNTDAGANANDTKTATVTVVKNQKKSGKRGKAIEGTIENTELFKMFVKSMAAIDKGETSSYMTENVSLLKSMDKELEREKERLDAIERRTNSALLALAGGKDSVGANNGSSNNGSNIKKKKKKRKKKEKEKVVGVSAKEKEKTKQKGRQITRVKNNVIIIEEAGRREMERRKELSLADLKKNKDKNGQQEEEKLPLKIKKRAELEAGTCR